MRAALALSVLALSVLTTAGCGKAGDLYLPDTRAGDIVTRPSSGTSPAGERTTAPNSPQTVDSPQQPASPAPEVTAPEAPPPPEAKKKDKKP